MHLGVCHLDPLICFWCCAAKGVVTMQKKQSKRPGFASLQESFAEMQ